MINECFLEFKDKHLNEKCLVMATGPTIDMFENKYDICKIGCNQIIYKDYIMDYYFLGDPENSNKGYLSDKETYNKYMPYLEKFYRRKSGGIIGIPEGEKATYYTVNNKEIIKDIAEGLYAKSSISIEMVQFALYAGFKDIYLIGQDCDYTNGTFKSPDARFKAELIITEWKKLKKFQEKEYSDRNIYVINPVKLTIFKKGDYKWLV